MHAGWWAGGRAGDVTRGAQLFGFRVQATLGGRSTLKEGHGKGMLHEQVQQERHSGSQPSPHCTIRGRRGSTTPTFLGGAAIWAGSEGCGRSCREPQYLLFCVYGRWVCPRERVRELGLEDTPMMLALWFWVCTGISSSERKSNSLLERHALHLVVSK